MTSTSRFYYSDGGVTLSRITDILHVMECRHPLPNRHISHFEHIRNQLVGDIADNVPLTPSHQKGARNQDSEDCEDCN